MRVSRQLPKRGIAHLLERLSHGATKMTGRSTAFAAALVLVIVWLVSGPAFGYSDSWQLVINTSTTVVTFLMVFLIQRTQNKESLTVQLKLNEIVAALDGASNRLIDAEDFSEEELEILHKHYRQLADLARHEMDIRQSHSIDEAHWRHDRWMQRSGLSIRGHENGSSERIRVRAKKTQNRT